MSKHINKNPHFLLKIAIFSMPFSDLGSPIPLVNLTLFILLIYVMVLAPSLLKRNTFNEVKKPLSLLIILYLLILVISIINFVPYTRVSMSFIRQFPLYIMVVYILSDAMIKGNLSLRVILIYYIAGFTFMSILFLMGIDVKESEEGRRTILGINANKIAIYGNVAILFCLNLLQKFRFSNQKRYLLYFLFPIFIYMIVSTGSRGGVIGLLLSILIYYYFKGQGFQGKFGNSFKGLLIIGILVLVFLSNDLLYQRFFQTGNEMTSDRSSIWEVAYSIVSNNLIFGVGVFKYESEMIHLYGKYKATHNEFLSILIFSGMIGLSVFLYFLTKVYKCAIYSNRNQQNPIFISLFALMVFTLFKGGGFFLTLFLWFVFSLILTSNVNFGKFKQNYVK
jgi:O-antigen ligase